MSEAALSMREKVPYPYMSPDDMQEYLVERLLYKFRRADDQELTMKIELAYKERYGCKMLPLGTHVENICLHGTPGQGKTSAVRSAAKIVADILKMNLVMNPVPPYLPQPNDIVMSTLEMSGEVSNIIMGGIPVADQLGTNDKVPFMNKLPLYQLAIMSRASAGILLLDDFVNAAPSVQNSALSIALEGRFQMLDLGNTYVALTANLGSLDNSDVVPLSDPMIARIGHFYIEDNVPDFVVRMQDKYPDLLGDCGVASFLNMSKDNFMFDTDSDMRQAKNGLRTPFPCSRSWEKFINEMRIMSNRLSDPEKLSVGTIAKLGEAFVGPHAAKAFAGYRYNMITGAEPMARDLILHDNFNEKELEKRYGQGLTGEQQNFGYQLAFCLAGYAASELQAGKDETTVMARYTKALLMLDDPTVTLSVSEFGGKLTRIMPEWTLKSKVGAHLNQESSLRLCQHIFKSGKVHEDLGKAIPHAILGTSGRDNYSSAVKAKSKKTNAASAPSP